eukprot:TRINITY_DN12536_c0_g1_i2.p1 TRINITY_DN12536_c0_g1~~TRINITY_DN12536_c0_g1_i2.p1  ORF type:complete len:649 (+),score=144.69 TRINITY_DN12536_c0_g1_i2:1156-3102(+)
MRDVEHHQVQLTVGTLYQKKVFELEQELDQSRIHHSQSLQKFQDVFEEVMKNTKTQLLHADDIYKERDGVQLELLASLKEKISELVSQIRQTKETHLAEKTQLERKLRETTDTLEAHKREFAQLSEESAKDQMDHQSKIESLQNLIANLKKDLQETKEEIYSLQAHISQEKASKREYFTLLGNKESEIVTLVAQRRDLNERLQGLSGELAQTKMWLQKSHMQLGQYKHQIDRLKHYVIKEFQSAGDQRGEEKQFSSILHSDEQENHSEIHLADDQLRRQINGSGVMKHRDLEFSDVFQDGENEDLDQFLSLATELKELQSVNKSLHSECDEMSQRLTESQRQYTQLEGVLQQTVSNLESTRESLKETSKQHESLKHSYNSIVVEAEGLRETVRQLMDVQEKASFLQNASAENSKQIENLNMTIQGLDAEKSMYEKSLEEIQKRINNLHEEKSNLMVELNQSRIETYDAIRVQEFWKQISKEAAALFENYRTVVSKAFGDRLRASEESLEMDSSSTSRSQFQPHILRRMKGLEEELTQLLQSTKEPPSSLNGIRLAPVDTEVLSIPKTQYVTMSNRLHHMHQILWDYDKALCMFVIDFEKSRAMALEARRSLKALDESFLSVLSWQSSNSDERSNSPYRSYGSFRSSQH